MPKKERRSAQEMVLALERWGFEREPVLRPMFAPLRELAAREAEEQAKTAGFSNRRRRPVPAAAIASPEPEPVVAATRKVEDTTKVEDRAEDESGHSSIATRGDEPSKPSRRNR
jgi:hypothetical protein